MNNKSMIEKSMPSKGDGAAAAELKLLVDREIMKRDFEQKSYSCLMRNLKRSESQVKII